MKNRRDGSISQIIASSKNKRVKRCLEAYTLYVVVLLFYYEGVVIAFAFLVGSLLVVWVKTESNRVHEDEFQTGYHCAGMVIVILVAVFVFTSGRELLWITQFASVFPYFFMFISSVDTHTSLKVHAEVKMFKHLFDGVALLFARNGG